MHVGDVPRRNRRAANTRGGRSDAHRSGPPVNGMRRVQLNSRWRKISSVEVGARSCRAYRRTRAARAAPPSGGTGRTRAHLIRYRNISSRRQESTRLPFPFAAPPPARGAEPVGGAGCLRGQGARHPAARSGGSRRRRGSAARRARPAATVGRTARGDDRRGTRPDRPSRRPRASGARGTAEGTASRVGSGRAGRGATPPDEPARRLGARAAESAAESAAEDYTPEYRGARAVTRAVRRLVHVNARATGTRAVHPGILIRTNALKSHPASRR